MWRRHDWLENNETQRAWAAFLQNKSLLSRMSKWQSFHKVYVVHWKTSEASKHQWQCVGHLEVPDLGLSSHDLQLASSHRTKSETGCLITSSNWSPRTMVAVWRSKWLSLVGITMTESTGHKIHHKFMNKWELTLTPDYCFLHVFLEILMTRNKFAENLFENSIRFQKDAQVWTLLQL